MPDSSLFPEFLQNEDRARILIEESLRYLSTELQIIKGQWVVINLRDRDISFSSNSLNVALDWLKENENNEFYYLGKACEPVIVILAPAIQQAVRDQ